MNNHIDEKKYILSSRKIKKLDWNIECSDFHARIFDFKFLEYNRERKKRKLYVKDHAHSFCEIQFVIRGRNTYCINDSMISVSGGEFLMICPGVKHRLVDFTNEFSKISLCFALVFSEDSELSFLGEMLSGGRFFTGVSDDSFLEPMRYIFENIERCEDAAGNQMIKWQMLTAIVGILKYASSRRQSELAPSVEEEVVADREFYRTVVEYVRSNLAGKSIVTDLSRCTFMSERQVRRRLLQCCGKTPRQLIEQIRYEKIKELLLSQVPMNEICEIVGFSEESSLNRFFKRMEGMTPAQYRDQLTILNYQ